MILGGGLEIEEKQVVMLPENITICAALPVSADSEATLVRHFARQMIDAR